MILVSTGSGIKFAYALNQWRELGRFLDDARVPLDNNASERSLRRVARGRNYAESRIMQNGRFAVVTSGHPALRIIRGVEETRPVSAAPCVPVCEPLANAGGRALASWSRDRHRGTDAPAVDDARCHPLLREPRSSRLDRDQPRSGSAQRCGASRSRRTRLPQANAAEPRDLYAPYSGCWSSPRARPLSQPTATRPRVFAKAELPAPSSGVWKKRMRIDSTLSWAEVPHDQEVDRDDRRDREELRYFPPSNGNACRPSPTVRLASCASSRLTPASPTADQ